MKFRTIVEIPKYDRLISYQSSILCMGSCFASQIGQKLAAQKFDSVVNPHGIAFNPVSMADHIKLISAADELSDERLFHHNELWHSLQHHGSFSDSSKQALLDKIRKANIETKRFLDKSQFIILTFGTANVYRHIDQNVIVANNHKLPADHFVKKKLSVQDCFDSMMRIVEQVRTIRPDIQFILTVSPIRHLRDGLIENQLSKGTLLLAVDQVVKNQKDVHYFPAYEILLDDLRDYRFYAEDMLHPSEAGFKYIWQKFKESIMNSDTRNTMDQVEKVVKSFHHRPLRPQHDQLKVFAQNQLSLIEALEEDHIMNWQTEKEYFHQMMQR